MKALSVRQPWANKIAAGKKTIETRRWKTNYRGPLLIASSAKPKIEPAGYVLAVATLIDCRPMVKSDEQAACCDVYDHAYAFVLSDIQRLNKPFSISGSLFLWECDKSIADVINIEYELGCYVCTFRYRDSVTLRVSNWCARINNVWHSWHELPEHGRCPYLNIV